MTTAKTIALNRWTFVGKVMSLVFNMLSRLVIIFLPRSKRLNFMTAVTICSDFGAQKNKVFHYFHCFPIYLPWSDGARCHDLGFLNVEFKPTFSLSSCTFIKRLFSSSSISAIRVVSSAYLRLLIFLLVILIPAQLVLHPAWHFTWCTLHISYISRVTIHSLDVLLSQFGSKCYFLLSLKHPASAKFVRLSINFLQPCFMVVKNLSF